jgi:outer membrane receptor protein involved in Fe transport
MRFVILFLLSITSQLLIGQNQYSITGSITDDQNIAIPFANAAAYTKSDSLMVTGSVSDEAGKFVLNLKPGSYYLKITFLSYKEKLIPDLVVTDADIDLGGIVLKTNTHVLREVQVTGERAQMELQLDKRVFNVGQDMSNVGGNAADILGNIPAVTVDTDGTVSLRGSENVRILIDGKPSGLTSRDPDALRQLQSNLVERVEIITNPSSRYDAAGEVGIINIILKKNSANGFNGSFTANAGYPDFYGGAYTINIRRKKFNVFSSYGMDYRSNSGYSRSFQDFKQADTSYTQNSTSTSTELSHNIIGGLDYFINETNTITGSLQYNVSDGLNKSLLTYQDFRNEDLIRTSERTDREVEDEENIEASLNYKKEFTTQGREFVADFKYIKSVDDESSDYTQTGSDNSSTLQRGENTALEKSWLFQSDYVHPFGDDGKAEIGIKSATRIVNNDYKLEQFNDEGEWTIFPAFNNNMIYTERIHAAYFMAGKKLNKLSLQTGLRGEYSDITTELTVTNEVNHRQYFNLFPSANLGYELNKNQTLQLSYSYRINRPEFRDLLPFSSFTDVRQLFVGNPNLNPEYTHAFETGYLVNWESGSILSSVYYRARKGVIQRINEVDEDGITRIIPVNLATQDAYGFEFNFSLSVHNWWQINSSANLYRAITEGQYQEERLYSDTYSMNTRTTSKMTFFKSLAFQSSFNYNAPRVTTQGKQLSSYSIDLGLSKDVLKGKGTLTANVRDLTNARLRRNIVDIEDYYSRSVSQRRPRQFMLTFTYRLNRNSDREERNDQDGGGGGEQDEF